ncbi:MAG: FHA domain-containing protein [Acidimicrobiales bacterium]|nr:MAG: FHA domain-containing protein [Acidimicrobiales bacterium]
MRGIHVTAGNGIVACIGNFVAFAQGEEDGLNQLIVRLNALADAPWSETVRTVTSDIAASGFQNHPALACASVLEDRVATLVFGAMKLHVETDEESRVLDGSESSTWIDVAVHGTLGRMYCGTQSESTVVGVLRDGVIPAGGFLLDAAGPIPAAVRWEAMDEDQARTETESRPEPEEPVHLSVVPVAEETSGLFSRPNEDHKRTTTAETPDLDSVGGAALEPVEEPIDVPEPPVDLDPDAHGILTFDDGAQLQLTRSVAIGREVPDDYLIDGRAPTIVLLDDAKGLVSPVHLELRMIGDEIEVVDMNSSHGTFIRLDANASSRTRLRPNMHIVIESGTIVELGDRSFTYADVPRPEN